MRGVVRDEEEQISPRRIPEDLSVRHSKELCVVFHLYPTLLHKQSKETTADFELHPKDNAEPVNKFHPKHNKLRRVLWEGHLATMDDVSEGTEVVRSLLMWCREEMMRD